MTLEQLLNAARSIAPNVEVKFRGTADENEWVCMVVVGHDAVIFESKPGPMTTVIADAGKKLCSMSQRMRAVLKTGEEPPSSGSV